VPLGLTVRLSLLLLLLLLLLLRLRPLRRLPQAAAALYSAHHFCGPRSAALLFLWAKTPLLAALAPALHLRTGLRQRPIPPGRPAR
jgi:hypothetical protein